MSNIVIYEKNISAVDYINKAIETKGKRNQINVLSMESMLGDNFRVPLLHISKRYPWIEETSQRINEFSFGYMFNPTLHTDKILLEQVKACVNNTFGADTKKHINKTTNSSTLVFCFINVIYICLLVSGPNMCFKHAFTCSINFFLCIKLD